MFSDLHSKISKDLAPKNTPLSRSSRPSFTANSRTNSNESLVSLGSAAGSVHHKSDRIKSLESKIAELGSLIRQKNASLEAGNIEIERLKKEVEKACIYSQSNLQIMNEKHTQNLSTEAETAVEDDSKRYGLLSQKLRKAEEDLQTVNRISDELSKQNNDLRMRTHEELERLRKLLTQSDLKAQSLQADLDTRTVELQRTSCELTQLQNEFKLRNNALEELKLVHSKVLENKKNKDDSSQRLRLEVELAEQKVSELTNLFERAKASVAQQELQIMQANDRASETHAEAEKLRNRLSAVEARAIDRESDLKDRIRILEERLVLLTEPSSELFAHEMAEASKDLSEYTTGTAASLSDGTTPEAARCMSLLVERKLLETRLIDTRQHLDEVKTNWNDTLLTLESQIAHLNKKISDDTAEHEAEQASWIETRQQMECKLVDVSGQLCEAKERLRNIETELSVCRRSVTDKEHEWDIQLTALKSRLSVLLQKTADDAVALSQSIQREKEFEAIISDLRSELSEVSAVREAKDLEIVSVQAGIVKQSTEVKFLRDELESMKTSAILHQTNLKETAQKFENMASENESLHTEIASIQRLLTLEKEEHGLEKEALLAEISKLKSDFQTTKSLLTEAENSLASVAEQYKKVNLELESVQSKLRDSDMKHDLDFAAEASMESASLKASIESLNEQISERNKTIRLQKQKIVELKRALGNGLQGSLPTATGSLAEEDTPTRTFLSKSQTDPNGQNHQFLRPGSPSLPDLDGAEKRKFEEIYRNAPPDISWAKLPVQTMDHSDHLLNHTSDLDTINFGYLRHVILKFLLSKESEALQLVRAVSAILKLSKEDEFLVKQNLESRISWFSTPAVSPKKSGQFAKVISPPF